MDEATRAVVGHSTNTFFLENRELTSKSVQSHELIRSVGHVDNRVAHRLDGKRATFQNFAPDVILPNPPARVIVSPVLLTKQCPMREQADIPECATRVWLWDIAYKDDVV